MKLRLVVIIGVLFTLMACSGVKTIMGAGATFPEPLYSKMFSEYNKLNPKVEINYQPIGSGGGIRQLITKTVTFGATDVKMNENELKEAGSEIVHIPTCIGAVAIIYNLEVSGLRLSPDVLVDIFLGKITKWNDKRIKELNPNLNLPDLSIVVVKRSDGSGTTYTLSEYLATVSKEWSEKIGVGKSLNWPTGIGAKGNTGVAAYVKQTMGSIGYVEKSYATQNNLKVTLLKNKAGDFVLPEPENIKAAASGVDVFNNSIINSSSKNAYPISSVSWIIVYKDLSSTTKNLEEAKELAKFLWWVTHDGQKYNKDYDFASLPESLLPVVEDKIYSLTYKGAALIEKN
ncbi:MAG: phosphate ABC transporter substrate-binding protein PstS [Brevinematales bacterium]|nr:phosphate ABC transporter substrate-binding protein PstS [Brevinematales bacterium]